MGLCVPRVPLVYRQQKRLDRDACGWRKQFFIIFWVCCLCNMTSKNIPNTGRDTSFWRLPEFGAGVLPVKRVPATQCLFDHSWCQVLSAPGLEARRFPPGRRATAPVGFFYVYTGVVTLCATSTREVYIVVTSWCCFHVTRSTIAFWNPSNSEEFWPRFQTTNVPIKSLEVWKNLPQYVSKVYYRWLHRYP